MIKNLEEALAPLKALQQNAKAAKDRAELIVAERIAEDARAAAPGSLGSKISVAQTGEETVVDGGDDLSAYVEFGTGVGAEKFLEGEPDEVKQEAFKFFVNGEGRLNAHPFFFPAVFLHRDELSEEIDKQLNDLNA